MPETMISINIELWQMIVFAVINCLVLYVLGVIAAGLAFKSIKTNKENKEFQNKVFEKLETIDEQLLRSTLIDHKTEKMED